ELPLLPAAHSNIHASRPYPGKAQSEVSVRQPAMGAGSGKGHVLEAQASPPAWLGSRHAGRMPAPPGHALSYPASVRRVPAPIPHSALHASHLMAWLFLLWLAGL